MLDLDLDALFDAIGEREQERERQKRWLGTLLERAREQGGWSVEQVVEAAGLEPADTYEMRLRRLESGEYRFPMMDELAALCEALEIRQLQAYAAYQRECEYYDRLDGRAQAVVRLMPAFYNRTRTTRPPRRFSSLPASSRPTRGLRCV